MSNRSTVCILMSTYNGEKYIIEQLNSLLNQEDISAQILIRDDGSTDNTINIIKKYASLYKQINVIYGTNIGVKNSFFELIRHAPNAQYYAFCDQDDIWDNKKLINAVQKMKNNIDEPMCYFSNYRLIDQNNNIILDKGNRHKKQYLLADILYSNPAPGCSMVLNNKLWSLLKEQMIPENTFMHDRWILLVSCFIGKVIYDNKPSFSYRQHSNNTVGYSQNTFVMKIVKKVKDIFLSRKIPVEDEVQEIYKTFYKKIHPKYNLFLTKISTYQSSFFIKISLLLDSNLKCSSLLTELILKIRIIIFNRI